MHRKNTIRDEGSTTLFTFGLYPFGLSKVGVQWRLDCNILTTLDIWTAIVLYRVGVNLIGGVPFPNIPSLGGLWKSSTAQRWQPKELHMPGNGGKAPRILNSKIWKLQVSDFHRERKQLNCNNNRNSISPNDPTVQLGQSVLQSNCE